MKGNMIRHRRRPGSWTAGRLDGKRTVYRVRAWTCTILSAILVMLAAVAPAAQSDEPMEVIKTNVAKVLDVLRDPALQEPAAVDRKKEAIRNISNDMFHWTLLSRRVLAKNWESLTPDQQKEFVDLFKDILEQAYIDRILAYKDETIEYVSSQMLSDNKAEVVTRVISGGTPVNLTYRLGLLGGKWGVYDVIAEGVSLTSNYRTQFRDYLADKTPEQLLEHMREKVGE